MLLVRHFIALPWRRHCLLGNAILSSARAGCIGFSSLWMLPWHCWMLLVRRFTALPWRRHCLLGDAILSSVRAGSAGLSWLWMICIYIYIYVYIRKKIKRITRYKTKSISMYIYIYGFNMSCISRMAFAATPAGATTSLAQLKVEFGPGLLVLDRLTRLYLAIYTLTQK